MKLSKYWKLGRSLPGSVYGRDTVKLFHLVSRALLGFSLLIGHVNQAAGQFEVFEESAATPTVIGSHGGQYEIPFFGGFNNPVPQLIDIDGDGDNDLFVQEYPDRIQFYENTGGSQTPEFVLRSRDWYDQPVGDWYHFSDVDEDGDFDLLTGQTFNAIRYYENIGSSSLPAFELRADSLRSSDGTPVTTEPPNIPAIADMNCDGVLDLLVGRNTGSITLFSLTGIDDGIPIFDFVEDSFQDILVVGGAGKYDRHGANGLAVGDVNGDDLTDLLWGDFFEPSIITFTNTGTNCQSLNLERTADTLRTLNSDPFITRGYNIPTLGDLNGDNILDLVVGVLSNATVDDENSLYYFSNSAGSGWSLETTRLVEGVDTGTASVPAFGDVDDDGLIDLVVANSIGNSAASAELFYFKNTGTEYALIDSTLLEINLGFGYHPEFGDLDADGDDDLVIGVFSGTVAYMKNEGPLAFPQFVLQTDDVLGTDVGSNAAPELVDLDGDDDLDMIVGESSGELNFFENTGDPQNPQFLEVPEFFAGVDVGQNSAPAVVDFTNTGLYSIAIGSESNGMFFLENIGSSTAPAFGALESVSLSTAEKATPEFDSGAFPDLVVGTVSGGLIYFRNTTVNGASSDRPRTEKSIRFDIYPNPAADILHVRTERGQPLPVTITVYDALGRRAIVEALHQNASTQLDVSELSPGLYLVVAELGTARSSAAFAVAR